MGSEMCIRDRDASLEKKRAFLESKEIPVETIDQVLKPELTPSFQATDFQSFQEQQQQRPSPQPKRAPAQTQTTTGPPIITYPEFLVEAHKPPPLITPARILTATYVAGGLATLVYGASKYLINPMIGNLTEARHEFSEHSQSKIDEFNDRLSKIVSKVPEPKKPAAAPPSEVELDDAESITSDPTELYHRDMGTQTISPPTTPPLPSSIPPAKKDAVTHDTNALSIINSHLTELLDDIEKHDAAVKERQESTNKLRHYLDQLLYASPGVSAWAGSEDAFAMGTTKKAGEGKKPDMVEELKKEIRGVKGVLLSARRFPGVGR